MSKATTELKIEVSGGRICIPLDVTIPDGKYRLVLEEEESRQNTKTANIVSTAKVTTNLDDVLILIEASKLSMEDDCMKYQPKEYEIYAKQFKERLANVIYMGIVDFYRPRFDPSFANEEHTEICYIAGKKPAVGKSVNDWIKMAKNFCPERGSRLMKNSEYIAFCGWLIKKLVENGWSRENAWKAVCKDSTELGHYRNSKNARNQMEVTKSREVLGLLYDLGNTHKILYDKREGHWMTMGYNWRKGYDFPIAYIEREDSLSYNDEVGVGLLAFSK